jgi:hypothetical protein
MSRLSKSERARLPASDFADEAHRVLPVLDSSDVLVACRLAPTRRDPERVLLRVVELARRRGIEVPLPLAFWAYLRGGVGAVNGLRVGS